jgi:hypothetical protein
MRLVRPSLAANVQGVVNEVLAKLAANVVLDPPRTFVDERDGLQPAIPLVCESKCRRRSLGCDDLHLKTRALDGADLATEFVLAQAVVQARAKDLISDEHFTVDARCWKHGQVRRIFSQNWRPSSTGSYPLVFAPF